MPECLERRIGNCRCCPIHQRTLDVIKFDAKRVLDKDKQSILKETIQNDGFFTERLLQAYSNHNRAQVPGMNRKLFNPWDHLEKLG